MAALEVVTGVTALKELKEKRRYSLGKFGRRRLNEKLGLDEHSLQLTSQRFSGGR